MFPFNFLEIGPNTKNEDERVIFEYEDGIIMAIFDGHFTNVASKFCVKNLKKILNESKKTSSWIDRLGETIKSLNKKLFNDNFNSPKLCGGTTASIIFVSHKNDVYIANIGDSQAVIYDKKTGNILKNDTYETKDYMEKEFKTHGISPTYPCHSYFEKKYYVTKPHNYNEIIKNGKNIYEGKREHDYYMKISKDYFFQKSEFIHYLYCPYGKYTIEQKNKYLQDPEPGKYFKIISNIRIIGDFSVKDLIREPEVYHFKLTKKQRKNCIILIMSDGMTNHNAFTVEKIGKFLVNPLEYLMDCENIISHTDVYNLKILDSKSIISDFPKINELDKKNEDFKYKDNINTITNLIIKNFEKIIKSLCSNIRNDELWIETIKKKYEEFSKLIKEFDFTKNIVTYPSIINSLLPIMADIAIMLGSTDNITLVGLS